MGIFCEINLFKPRDGAYKPGQSVSGLIKYAVDEPMEFDKITTSLKGSGYVVIKVKRNKKSHRYTSREVYVDADNVVQNERIMVPVGSYEIKFSFILPSNLPSSLKIHKRVSRGTANCKIKYYLRVKFERPGLFAPNKHFRKEITVIAEPNASPTLPREPIVYGERKKVMQLFSSKDNIVNLKATMLSSVIPIGGKIEMHYEVKNNSDVLVKSVETQLIEIYHFNATRHKAEYETTIPDTDSKTSSIKCGDTQIMPVQINVPSELHSLENCKIISRTYAVRIEVTLPFPHFNMVLNMPVQTGVIDAQEYRVDEGAEGINYNEAPPSYWETMGETNKGDDEKSDGESSDNEYVDQKN